MNFWFELQRNMMKSWPNLGQPAKPANPFFNGFHANGASPNPWMDTAAWNPWGEVLTQQMQNFWFGGGQNSFNWFEANMTESTKRTAEKLLESQMVALKMFEGIAQSWTAAAQTGEMAKWQAEFTRQMEEQVAQLRTQWDASTTQMSQLTESSSHMWQTYMEQLQQTGMPWLNAWTASAEQGAAWFSNMGVGKGDPTNLMGHFWKAYDESVGKMVSSPPLGLNREVNLELTKGYETWLTYRRADADYQRVVSGGWLQFATAFGQRLAQMAQAGKLIESPRQFIDLWVEVGDEEFTKLFHGEEYALAQGALVNSSMAFKRQQRTLLEIGLRQQDMPTRSDLDEAHRTIYELRKEMKALKKEVRGLQQSLSKTSMTPPAQSESAVVVQKEAIITKPSPKTTATKAAATKTTATKTVAGKAAAKPKEAAKRSAPRKSASSTNSQVGR